MRYRPGEFSELSIRNGMKEWVESRRDICDDPRIYDELPQEVKDVLDTWISTHITPRRRFCSRRSSYGLKADFQRETGIYVYTGVLHGALLATGHQPVNPKEAYWRFEVSVLP